MEKFCIMRDSVDSVIKQWRADQSLESVLDSINSGKARPVVDWLADCIVSAGLDGLELCWASDVDGPNGECNWNTAYQAIQMFWPEISRNNGPDQISIYESWAKRAEGKRLSLKPGRALRRIFPTLPDTILEKLVDSFKRKFDLSQFELIWGDSRADFAFAYDNRNSAQSNNIRYESYRKSMSSSCMRYSPGDFGNGTKFHPAEFYASPDFRILYAKLKGTERVSARVIVRLNDNYSPVKYSHAPIYGMSDNAIDAIEMELNRVNSSPADDDSENWRGARLLNIPIGQNRSLACYMDCGPCKGFLDSDEEYIILDYSGDIGLCSTSGFCQATPKFVCCICDESLDEDFASSDDDGNPYCDECYSERFGYCESCEETCVRDEMQTGYYVTHSGRFESREICRDCARRHYTRTTEGNDSDEYWTDDSVVQLANGEYISPRDFESGDYFISDSDEGIYSDDERAELPNGEVWTIDQARDAGLIEFNDSWISPEDLESIIRDERESQSRIGDDDSAPILPGLAMLADRNPEESGLINYTTNESLYLAKYPQIGKLWKANGETWYYWTPRPISYSGIDSTREFPTLAECVANIRAEQ